MEIQEILREAERFFTDGKFSESTKLLTQINDACGPDSYRCCCIGRNYFYQGDLKKAKDWLERSLKFPEPFDWGYYELAVVEGKQGNLVLAATHILSFLGTQLGDATARGYNHIHCNAIIQIAHNVYEIDRALATKIYKSAASAGIEDYLSALRIIEDSIALGAIGIATDLMSKLRVKHELNAWGFLALGRIHQMRNEGDAAQDALNRAVALQSSNSFILVTAAHRLIDLEKLDDAESLLARLVSLNLEGPVVDPEKIVALQFRLATHRRDVAGIARILEEKSQQWRAVERWILVEALFALNPDNQSELEITEIIRTCILSEFRGTVQETHALLYYYSQRRMRAEGLELLEQIKDTPAFSTPEVVVARFELCCAIGDTQSAKTLYEEYFAGRDLNNWECRPAIRFLAEQKRWTEAGHILKQAMANGYFSRDAAHSFLLVARHAAIQEQLLAVIDKVIAAAAAPPSPDLLSFRQLLVDDICIKAGSERLGKKSGKSPAQDRLSRENRVLLSKKPAEGLPPLALFMCTDKNYFFSVMTFIASYVTHNKSNGPRIAPFVFLSHDVPTPWIRILRDFGAKLDFPVEIIEEKDFIPPDKTHSEAYGIFTGGNTLSRAAYFRLYAARFLSRQRNFLKLCYIDSDIVCQGDLEELFDYDLGKNLIAARCEELSPEVRDAALANELEAESYFNSGVLLLDFANKDTGRHIEVAISLAETEASRLTFHDQCALNIAFAGKASQLPAEFNFFLRPHRRENGSPEQAKLVHFLDRPKPWDISYTREYRPLWSRHAELVRLLLDRDEYQRIVSAANGGTFGQAKPAGNAKSGAGAGPSAGAAPAVKPKPASKSKREAKPATKAEAGSAAEAKTAIKIRVARRPGALSDGT